MTAWLALLPAISGLLDKIIPDPEARERAKMELQKEENSNALEQLRLLIQSDQMQADINKVEAAHPSLFVSGARPFIMWTCGVAFAYHFVLQPFLAFVISNHTGVPAILPMIDMEVVGYTLTGVLGIGGGFRTFEKIKGVTK